MKTRQLDPLIAEQYPYLKTFVDNVQDRFKARAIEMAEQVAATGIEPPLHLGDVGGIIRHIFEFISRHCAQYTQMTPENRRQLFVPSGPILIDMFFEANNTLQEALTLGEIHQNEFQLRLRDPRVKAMHDLELLCEECFQHGDYPELRHAHLMLVVH